jgi:transaldolase
MPVDAMREKRFRWTLNEGQVATEKLSGGIRLFVGDLRALQTMVERRLTEAA